MAKKYRLIYADPPWQFRDECHSGSRGAGYHYPLLSVRDIARLPVEQLADDNCILAMWWVYSQPAEALQLLDAWGFRLITMGGFTWGKIAESTGNPVFGMGSTSRANSECCLFAVKGKINRESASVSQLVLSPRGQHSEKPAIVRDKLVELFGDVPRIELFSRQKVEGWDQWGNDAESPALFYQPGYWMGLS
jgi:N6-adenosine-specific RNA methylase IME4